MQTRLLTASLLVAYTWNQKSYHLACISMHPELTSGREKGTYLTLPSLNGRMPLQIMLKMGIIYVIINLSSVCLGPGQTRGKSQLMTTVPRSAWTRLGLVIGLQISIYITHKLISKLVAPWASSFLDSRELWRTTHRTSAALRWGTSYLHWPLAPSAMCYVYAPSERGVITTSVKTLLKGLCNLHDGRDSVIVVTQQVYSRWNNSGSLPVIPTKSSPSRHDL